MFRLFAIWIFVASVSSVSAQMPRTLIEAGHCVVEKQMIPDRMQYPLRAGYSVDKHSFDGPEIFLVFLHPNTKKSGLVIGLAREHTRKETRYYLNNNAGFVVHARNIDFTSDAPLGGLATQAAIQKGIRSVLSGKLYTVTRKDFEQRIKKITCVGWSDSSNRGKSAFDAQTPMKQ